jgi:hypothetical protein
LSLAVAVCLPYATQSIALPADANVAAMQMQRDDGLVEIFIPRGL